MSFTSTISRTNKTFKDIDLSFEMNPITHDIGVKTNENAVRNSVSNLILSPPYSHPMHPEISCQAYNALFGQMTMITEEILRNSVIQVLNKFEPRIQLNSVTVTGVQESHRYDVTIAYTIIGTTKTTTVNISLDKVR
jgi:phage baseplate assembly protein W